MATCSAKKSSAPPQTNYWKNYEHDRGYDGYYRFNKDQFYEGGFFRRSLHGQGTYKWQNLAVYEGGFYSNYKEGYAGLSLTDNSYFEGLFIENQPFGPGILTHSNGRQDVGFWMGNKLVRLSRAVDFIIPRLAPTSAAKIKLLRFRRLIPVEDNYDSATDILRKTGCLREPVCNPYSNLLRDPRSIFFEKEAFEKAYFNNTNGLSQAFMKNSTDWRNTVRYSDEDIREEEGLQSQPIRTPSHCLCPRDVFLMEYKNLDYTDICDVESFNGEGEMGILSYFTKYGTIEGLDNRVDVIKSNSELLNENFIKDNTEETRKDKSKIPRIVSWNRSEICTEMIRQIFRYRAFEDELYFNLTKLMLGARTAFRRTGEKEKQCLQFLKMCSIGPAHMIKEFICSYEINEELMDARGNNSLMFAAATDQHEIMDVLLDFGVDVNAFNDESLTPLNLCLLRRLAQTNAIGNWETAFLPKEIDKAMISDNYTETEGIECPQSIASLDRIFGDGMSISNSETSISFNKICSITPPTSYKNAEESSYPREGKIRSTLSQITLLKVSKSEESPNFESKNTKLKKSVSAFTFQRGDELTKETGSTDPTPRMNVRIVPQSNKREEFEKSIQQSSSDKYLFEFSFETKPKVVGNQGKSASAKSSKGKANKTQRESSKEEEVEVERISETELTKKVAEIDKTIEKLLKRGANPNISEVPKPSIHLGVYTKDVKTVYALLLHGACPDSQLYSSEGLLTPLHVVVLQKPAQEYIDICEVLLKFGANPEEETVPEFSLCEEEKEFLDPEQGRTPLQLLCMRPDLEYVNGVDNLITIGLMLAKVSDKRHFYKGHSCLTLAMRSNNLKLLKALLDSKYYDPNEVLGEDVGTALHFLVSAELQKKTSYETSTKMCDLLIEGGANPLKKLKSPKKLVGTCVDYGYREIEEQREKRKLVTSGKKSEKVTVKDTLKDHEKVVEHLEAVALEMVRRKATKHSSLNTGLGKKEYQDSFKKEFASTEKTSENNDEKSVRSNKVKEEGKENAQDTAEKNKKQDRAEKDVSDDLKKNTNKSFGSEKDKSRKQLEEEERKDTKSTKGKETEREKEKAKEKVKEKETDKEKAKEKVKEKETDKEKVKEKVKETDKEKVKEKAKEKETDKEKVKEKAKEKETDKEKVKEKAKEKETDKEKVKEKVKETEKVKVKEKAKEKVKERAKEKETDKDKVKEKVKEKDRGAGIKRSLEEAKTSKKNATKKIKREQPPTEKHKTKDDENVRGKWSEKANQKTDPDLLKPTKSSTKRLSLKKSGTRSETFPERLRQTLLRIYGECANLDINEFLIPYVVLRNGDLYYRFKGKADRKEQYSLI